MSDQAVHTPTSAPVFLSKGQTMPLFSSKSIEDKCDSIRVTAAWGTRADLDLIAGVMKGSALSKSPMGMIYQANDKTAQTLRVEGELVATLLDDDTDGDSDAKKALEACVVKTKNMVRFGYDSVVFGVIGYRGDKLSGMQATITIDMMDADKNVLESKAVTLTSCNGTVASVATAVFKAGQWLLTDSNEDLGTQMAEAGLGEFWVGCQKVSAKCAVA